MQSRSLSASLPLALGSALACWCAPNAAAQHWFQAPRLTTEVSGVPSLDLADFNHDGAVDLFGALGLAKVFANDGSGYFGTLLASTPLGANELLPSRVLSDLDGDGELELVTIEGQPAAGLRIHRGLGGGQFAAGVFLPLPIGPAALRVGQADADPAHELALMLQFLDQQTLDLTYTLQWIDWNGAQYVLGAPVTTGPLNWGVQDVGCIDESGDGIDDLAIASLSTLYTYRTQPNPLNAPVAAGSQALAISNPSSAKFMQVADYDADGTREMLIYHGTTGTGYGAMLCKPQPGGGWSIGPFQALSINSQRPFAADWDGDGDLDLVMNAPVLILGGMQLLRNDGGSSFSLAASGSAINTGAGAGVADLDLDGFLDFAGPGSVVYGNGTFQNIWGGYTGFGALVNGLPMTDLEGDGDLDQAQQGAWLVNDGSGRSTTKANWPTLPPQTFFVSAIAFGDFSGDGRADWIAGETHFTGPFQSTFLGYYLLRDDGTGKYVESGLAGATTYSFDVAVQPPDVPRLAFDIDQDGDLDVLSNGGAAINDGGGVFTTKVALPGFGLPLRAADFDNDGELEIAALRDTNPDQFVLHDLVAPLSLSTTVLCTQNTLLRGISWFDIDGDTDRDLAITSLLGANEYQPQLFLWNGSSYDSAIPLPSAFGADQTRLAAEDVDGDGLTDLLVGSSDNPLLRIYPRIAPWLQYGPAHLFQAATAHAFEDLDEDGDLDFVGSNSFENRRFSGPSAGGLLQYGLGTPGTGGAVPLLGASGPFRPGSKTATLNLVQAKGPEPTYLAVSTASTALPNVPLPGLTSLVDPAGLLALVAIPATGLGTGNGQWHLSINVDPGLAGSTFFHQVFAIDVGIPGLVAQSNGLEIRYGQ